MPLHPCFADKLHLLEGIVSIEAALADPEQAPRLAEFMSQEGAQAPPEADVPTNGSEPRIVSIRPVTVVSTVGTIVPTTELTMLSTCASGP